MTRDVPVTDAQMDTVRGLPGGFLGQVLPFFLLFVGGYALYQHWAAVPDPYISHWNGAWEADGWTEKSFIKALLPAFLGAALCGLMLLLQIFLRHRAVAGQVQRKEPRQRFADLLRARAGNEVLLASELLMGAVFGLVTVGVPLAQTPRMAKLFVVSILAFSLGGSLLLTIWAVVRINRRMAVLRDLGADGDAWSDEHWTWGVIYSNPRDERLLVENRLGMGFTFNMARPAAKLLVAALLALPLVLVGVLLAL